MIKIGITGQNGFVGSHLYNTLSLQKDSFGLVSFDRSFFNDATLMANWVAQCDVVVHLAAVNRHPDPQVVHDTNIALAQKLVSALEASNTRPHVVFSSSSQEERDNPYGLSKKNARGLLAAWAEKNKATFTGMVIPNVFGPFGLPFYNSVVATFCHQLCHGRQPAIDVDGTLNLIYVGELVAHVTEAIKQRVNSAQWIVPHTATHKVSGLLAMLQGYADSYLSAGIMPSLANRFELNLFNTFRSYIPPKAYFPRLYVQHTDDRGKFVEIARLYQNGQVSFSTTHSGITRGNHFHTRKIERFAVIQGQAKIRLRKYNTDEVLEFDLDGNNAAYVDMPVWYTHNITNVGQEDLVTVFWINEFYDPADPDTYFETV
ncbi:MAG: NAD-dependent epimerase/dehydratase family protein [Edaphocola sp.]